MIVFEILAALGGIWIILAILMGIVALCAWISFKDH